MAGDRRGLAIAALLVGGCVVQHKLGDAEETGSASIMSTGEGSASVSSTTVGSGTGSEATSSDVSTGGGDPYAICGVELDHTGPPGTWVCGCIGCEFEQHDLTPASLDSFNAACTCLCDAGGCGGSVTVTTGGSDGDDGTSESGGMIGSSDGGSSEGSSSGATSSGTSSG